MIRIILVTLLLISCGKQVHEVKVEDSEHKVIYSVELGELKDIFKSMCELIYQDIKQPERKILVDECVKVKTGEFVDSLTEGEEEDE